MISIKEVWERYIYWCSQDRIGPDILATHWKLYFKSTMVDLCRNRFAHFGEEAEVRPGAYIIGCSRIKIGARVVIRPGCMLFADMRTNGQGIDIEDDVLIGSGVHIYTNNHDFSNTEIPIINQGHLKSAMVKIRKGAWIGANVIILPGVTVGENAVVGAGSIATRDIPARTVCIGAPARVRRSI
jgi:acetyltransferase-like isoleucine patch superfamily enzyme